MKYFETLCSKLLQEQDGLPGFGGAGAAAATPLAGMTPPTPATPAPQSMPSALPNNGKDPGKSALTSQKKLQLAKLIALALLTPLGDNNTGIIHKIRSTGNKPVVQGDAADQEKTVIKAIAQIQGDKVSSILDQIKYIPAETDDETSTNFISPDEYAGLVNLARTALTTSPNNIGGADRADISVYDINVNNLDQKIKDFKNLMSQSL